MAWQCLELEVAAEFGAHESRAKYEIDVEMRRIAIVRMMRVIAIQRDHHDGGRCWCGKERAPGSSRCAECTARRRARVGALISAGGCTRCGKMRDSDRKLCARCRAHDRRYRDRNQGAGLCRCGKARPAPGRMCDVCRERNRATTERNLAAGLCRCGRERVSGRKQCAVCTAKHQRVNAKRRAARKAAP